MNSAWLHENIANLLNIFSHKCLSSRLALADPEHKAHFNGHLQGVGQGEDTCLYFLQHALFESNSSIHSMLPPGIRWP